MKNTIKNIFYILGSIICMIVAVSIFITLWKTVQNGVFFIFGFGCSSSA